jgi:hypothetical protein
VTNVQIIHPKMAQKGAPRTYTGVNEARLMINQVWTFNIEAMNGKNREPSMSE